MNEILNRSSDPFFEQEETLDAIAELSGAAVSSMVIYCGAGATIDFTGLNWEGLNSRLLAQIQPVPLGYDEAKDLLKFLGPVELSSIIEESYKTKYEGRVDEARGHLHANMQNLLYNEPRWQNGRLAESIAAYVHRLVTHGVPVTVVTTNQDTFLEEVYDRILNNAASSTENHNAEVVVIGDRLRPRHLKFVRNKPAPKFIYLHGRIPPPEKGKIQGFIPNGEFSFSKRLPITSKAIREILANNCSHFIAVGTSLRDAPLINALESTNNILTKRYVLVKKDYKFLGDKNEVDRERFISFFKMRTSHLGLVALHADFYSQITQLFFNFSSSMQDESRRGSGIVPMTHRQRLFDWAKAWEELHLQVPDAVSADHSAAVRSLDSVRRALPKKVENLHGKEAMRIEVWRRNPVNREIILHAHTGGEIRDRSIEIRHHIEEGSGNSSVEAILQGRPVIRTAKDFERIRSDSRPWHPRWNAFFSVPILVASGGGVIFAGAVTICSMASESILTWSSMNQPSALRQIVQILTTSGVDILSLTHNENTLTQALEIVNLPAMPHLN
ncbi:SIR2 family protein [Arthrobacter sp. HLT1-20]